MRRLLDVGAIAIGLVLTAGPAHAAAPPVGQYAAELSAAATDAARVAAQVRTLAATRSPAAADVRAAARELGGVAGRGRDVLRRMNQSGLRDGTLTELVALRALESDLLESLGRLQELAGNPPPTPSARQRRVARRATDDFAPLVRQFAAAELQVSGLEQVLEPGAIRTIGRRLRRNATEYAEAEANRALRRFTGVGIVLGVPLKEQVARAGEAAVARVFSRLVVRAGPAGIAVQILLGRTVERIVELVGRRLREALRGKGNLERRTTRTVDALNALAAAWDALTAGGDPSVARLRALGRRIAEAVAATSFLQRDARRRPDLLARLQAAVAETSQRIAGYTAVIESQPFATRLSDSARLADRVGVRATELAASGPQPLGQPTAAVCVPATFTMEEFNAFGDRTGRTQEARFASLADGAHQYEKRCLWNWTGGAEAFVVFVGFAPPGAPGIAVSGDCGRTSPDPHRSDTRHITVGGGNRIEGWHAAGGDEAVLRQVLAAAEAAGVGQACSQAPR
jgi:hypothetical protein